MCSRHFLCGFDDDDIFQLKYQFVGWKSKYECNLNQTIICPFILCCDYGMTIRSFLIP